MGVSELAREYIFIAFSNLKKKKHYSQKGLEQVIDYNAFKRWGHSVPEREVTLLRFYRENLRVKFRPPDS